MNTAVSAGIAALSLLAGVAIGWLLARSRGSADLAERAERAERALKEESMRAQSALAAAQESAKRDVAALQAEMASRIERLNAEHRAESEKLARHLTEAYDELDKLRVRADAAKGRTPPDTGQGFPPTMPLGDL